MNVALVVAQRMRMHCGIQNGCADATRTPGSIPGITTSAHILRNTRTHFPPPRSRSPMKTALGSSPRRQSSMAPRAASVPSSSPPRDTSNPAVARRLDFEQDDSSLQETPALSGSGQRRGKRSDVYSIERSPSRQNSAASEERMVQAEISMNEVSVDFGQESFIGQVGDDSGMAADTFVQSIIQSDTEEEPQSEIVPEPVKEPVKEPAKRGRKRKSEVVEQPSADEARSAKSQKRGAAATDALEQQKKSRKTTKATAAEPRRSKRVSDVIEQEPSVLDASINESVDVSELAEEPVVAPKRRGRPPKAKPAVQDESPAPAKSAKKTSAKDTAKSAAKPAAKESAKKAPAETAKKASTKETTQDQTEAVFKMPSKPVAKPRGRPPKEKVDADPDKTDKTGKTPNTTDTTAGKPVDLYGNPLSKADIEQMSTTSVGSRFGRGRHLSIFREMEPDAVARVGRTGRHRVAPIDFWKNDRITYNTDGSMASILKAPSPEPQHRPAAQYKKSKKRTLTAVQEEEIELEPWEEDEGALVGNYKDFDSSNEFTSPGLVEGSKL
jgi:centromere protein C